LAPSILAAPRRSHLKLPGGGDYEVGSERRARVATILFPGGHKTMRLTWERRGRKVFEPRRRRYKTDDSAGRAESSTSFQKGFVPPALAVSMRETTTNKHGRDACPQIRSPRRNPRKNTSAKPLHWGH